MLFKTDVKIMVYILSPVSVCHSNKEFEDWIPNFSNQKFGSENPYQQYKIWPKSINTDTKKQYAINLSKTYSVFKLCFKALGLVWY
jgi:hypothetical protein